MLRPRCLRARKARSITNPTGDKDDKMPDRKTRQANRAYRKRARQSSCGSRKMAKSGKCRRASAVGNAMPGSRFREKHIRNTKRRVSGKQGLGKEIRQTASGLATLAGAGVAAKKYLFNQR